MDDTTVIDFGDSDRCGTWFTLNDDVMGGVSTSRFERTADGIGVFSGRLSRENNGGFASIRSARAALALGDATGLRMRVRGDGRQYSAGVLADDDQGVERSWRWEFLAPRGVWTEIDVPFEEMVLAVRGRRHAEAGPPPAGSIHGVSLLIADRDESPFRLEIAWIRARIRAR